MSRALLHAGTDETIPPLMKCPDDPSQLVPVSAARSLANRNACLRRNSVQTPCPNFWTADATRRARDPATRAFTFHALRDITAQNPGRRHTAWRTWYNTTSLAIPGSGDEPFTQHFACTSNPVFGNRDVSSNTLYPSPRNSRCDGTIQARFQKLRQRFLQAIKKHLCGFDALAFFAVRARHHSFALHKDHRASATSLSSKLRTGKHIRPNDFCRSLRPLLPPHCDPATGGSRLISALYRPSATESTRRFTGVLHHTCIRTRALNFLGSRRRLRRSDQHASHLTLRIPHPHPTLAAGSCPTSRPLYLRRSKCGSHPAELLARRHPPAGFNAKYPRSIGSLSAGTIRSFPITRSCSCRVTISPASSNNAPFRIVNQHQLVDLRAIARRPDRQPLRPRSPLSPRSVPDSGDNHFTGPKPLVQRQELTGCMRLRRHYWNTL